MKTFGNKLISGIIAAATLAGMVSVSAKLKHLSAYFRLWVSWSVTKTANSDRMIILQELK